MAEPVRLGIVGCGAVTERHHLPALKWVRAVKVVALADVNPACLERLGREYAIAKRFTSYRDLLEAADVDAVAVCVPPQLHAEVALAALAMRKHVFIEKPLALRLTDCDQLTEANGRDPSRKVMVGFNLRWHRLVRQTRAIIDRGELGPIKLVRTVFTSRMQPGASTWRTSTNAGGDVVLDLGVHHFDLVRFLLRSEVGDVQASATGSDRSAIVTLSMSNGAQVVCAFAEGTGENQAFEIYGDRGWLRVSCYRVDGLELFDVRERPDAVAARMRAARNTLLKLPRALYRSWSGGEFAASYVEEWNQFARAVLLDSAPEADLLDGRRALEIALAASRLRTK